MDVKIINVTTTAIENSQVRNSDQAQTKQLSESEQREDQANNEFSISLSQQAKDLAIAAQSADSPNNSTENDQQDNYESITQKSENLVTETVADNPEKIIET